MTLSGIGRDMIWGMKIRRKGVIQTSQPHSPLADADLQARSGGLHLDHSLPSNFGRRDA